MKDYLAVIITVILLALFYLGLPELDRALDSAEPKKLTKLDAMIMAIITVVFGIVEFLNLGNTVSPESFADLSRQVATIEFEDEYLPSNGYLFSGTGTGTYSIEFSRDGVNYYQGGTYEQSFGEVLKWHPVYFNSSQSVRYARIWNDGAAFLGELVFTDREGRIVPYRSDVPQINDEQETLCTVPDFMNSCYFDEIYHARTAWEHLNRVWPYEISHPPLGKLIIGLGISLFGMTPFGWRFSGALFGVMMLPLMYIFLKKMFDDYRVAGCGTLLLASDFLHFVQTRIATIDTYAVFFIMAMYLFMYLFVTTGERRQLALSGIAFGLGAACKWTCLYAGAGLAVIWLIYHFEHREKFLNDIPFSVLFFVIVPGVIYYLAYIPYGLAQGITPVFSKEYLRIVLDNQRFMFSYHANLSATHPYSSRWYQWMLDIRPILYYLETTPDGYRSSFGAFMNPLLCWGGLVAMVMLIYECLCNKCRTARFIVIGYLAQLVPWVFIKRLTFEYHYFPCSIFLVLAMGYVFGIMKKSSKWYTYAFTALSVLYFILFYPVLSGAYVDSATRLFHWLPSWPF